MKFVKNFGVPIYGAENFCSQNISVYLLEVLDFFFTKLRIFGF